MDLVWFLLRFDILSPMPGPDGVLLGSLLKLHNSHHQGLHLILLGPNEINGCLLCLCHGLFRLLNSLPVLLFRMHDHLLNLCESIRDISLPRLLALCNLKVQPLDHAFKRFDSLAKLIVYYPDLLLESYHLMG